jgi:integrase
MSRHRKTVGCIERRGNAYRVSLCVAGKRCRFTVKTTNRAIAEATAKSRYAELTNNAERAEKHRILSPQIATDMLSLIQRYDDYDLATRKPQTQRCYRTSLTPLRAFFGSHDNPDLVQVTPALVIEYATWRRNYHPNGTPGRPPAKPRTKDREKELTNRPKRATPIAERTVRKDLRILRLVFRRAEMEELRRDNPVSKAIPQLPKIPKFHPVILSDQELLTLLGATEHNPMLWFYTLLLSESGVRCDSEALFLRWEDFDLNDGMIHIATGRDADGIAHTISRPGNHDTKTEESRVVPITAHLRNAIIEHRRFMDQRYGSQEFTSPWVFHHTTTDRGISAGDRIQCFRKPFMRAARIAKIRLGFRQHDLRHRRVTTWLGAGHSAQIVMQAMGHADIRTTMGYYKLIPAHMRPLQQGSIRALISSPEPLK